MRFTSEEKARAQAAVDELTALTIVLAERALRCPHILEAAPEMVRAAHLARAIIVLKEVIQS